MDVPPPPDLNSAELYINRELSQLEFIRRVLAQAEDLAMPLLERLRFICISGAILDEFFEIRVAGLRHQRAFGATQTGPDGLTANEQLRRINEVARDLVARQYASLHQLYPLLDLQGVRITSEERWNARQRAWLKRYFSREILPILSPMTLDPAHPFPQLLNKSLAFMVTLEGKDAFGRSSGKAVVTAPRSLPRVIRLPESCAGCEYDFVLLANVVQAFVSEFFPGMQATGCFPFRVTRNSDLLVDPDDAEDLLRAVEGELSSRRFGDAVRLEVDAECPEDVAELLARQHGLSSEGIYQCDGPVNLMRLAAVPDLVERPDLKFAPFTPGIPTRLRADTDIFSILRDGDLLLHHPYQSFAPVVEFLRQAAEDPQVVAVRQTLYRTGTDSPVVQALVKAAQEGKEVLVVIELRARFDEEANIELANHLQKAGALVVYGVVGLKTHAKMSMVIRREGRSLRRYVHLGTGNYHMRTSRLYTDYGFFTCDPDIGDDVQKIFAQLTAMGRHGRLRRLLQAPFTLHTSLLNFIEREIANTARDGVPTGIYLKMNALVEPQVIRALYRASMAGVRVQLVVRGICCLRPGVAGVSDNIDVRSIVGRFLEHTRVFCFENGGERRVYLSSADWMGRNFFNRVETCFPVEDPALVKRVFHEVFELCAADNTQAWRLRSDGNYERATNRRQPVSVQQVLLAELSGA
ncbi:MAG: polyphosphate kinase 1 [Pseudomonadales bacterium]|nr:polyphosphate kinase 1 [Pseudomonadales bacterium]MCP5185680.1 polyphosphate kinase 1 [Pseudomonadales bacterium]